MDWLPPGYRLVETDERVDASPFSTHWTKRGAERNRDKWNARRGLLSYRYEVERVRPFRWEVRAYQNLLERE